MRIRKKVMRFVRRIGVFLLLLALIAGSNAWMVGFKRVEPDNPVRRHDEALAAEPVTGGRSGEKGGSGTAKEGNSEKTETQAGRLMADESQAEETESEKESQTTETDTEKELQTEEAGSEEESQTAETETEEESRSAETEAEESEPPQGGGQSDAAHQGTQGPENADPTEKITEKTDNVDQSGATTEAQKDDAASEHDAQTDSVDAPAENGAQTKPEDAPAGNGAQTEPVDTSAGNGAQTENGSAPPAESVESEDATGPQAERPGSTDSSGLPGENAQTQGNQGLPDEETAQPDDLGLPGNGQGNEGDVGKPGDGNGQNGDPLEEKPQVGPMDDADVRLVTNLSNCVLTYQQLDADILEFEAYIVNGTPDMYLKVKVQNSLTAKNGDYLEADGRNYTATLAREERNRVTLYMREGSKTVGTYTYVISYIAKKADAENAEVGSRPPVISTNLDNWTEKITNRNFTLIVEAENYAGETIYESSLLVQLDGKTVRYPTGNGIYEYELLFPESAEEIDTQHTVTVLAWDGEGNSAFRSYDVTFHSVGAGGVIGTCYVLVDMTTIGLGITESYTYEIKQDEPAAYAVLAMLEANGYACDYSGAPNQGFYLRRISQGGMAAGAHVPENLWQKILDDGLQLTGQKFADSVGEFDYTQGSGWMYSINGELYAGKSLASYYVNDGDTIYLRYTLAYGKDIGGSMGGYGKLSTYCGKWLNGTYIDQHVWQAQEILQQPSCAEDGVAASVCAVCGEKREQVPIPATGHDYAETDRKEPTELEAGYVTYTCAKCGDTYKEELPALGGGGSGGESAPETEPQTEPGGNGSGTEPPTEPDENGSGTEAPTDPDGEEAEPKPPTESGGDPGGGNEPETKPPADSGGGEAETKPPIEPDENESGTEAPTDPGGEEVDPKLPTESGGGSGGGNEPETKPPAESGDGEAEAKPPAGQDGSEPGTEQPTESGGESDGESEPETTPPTDPNVS